MVTYLSLLTDIPAALNAQNSEMIDEMPAIIGRAERFVVGLLDTATLRTMPWEMTVAPGELLWLPDDFLEVRQVAYANPAGGWMPIFPRQEEMLRARFSGRPPAPYPKYYAELYDRFLEMFPTPSIELCVRISANRRPPYLSECDPTNELTERHPDLLRAAALREGAVFMEDESQVAQYTQEAQSWAEISNRAAARRRRDESSQRPNDTSNVQGA